MELRSHAPLDADRVAHAMVLLAISKKLKGNLKFGNRFTVLTNNDKCHDNRHQQSQTLKCCNMCVLYV